MVKKLMALPVIGIVVAMVATAVIAASPVAGLNNVQATLTDGTDVSGSFLVVEDSEQESVMGTTLDKLTVSGFTAKSGFTAADYKVVDVFDVFYVVGGVKTPFTGNFSAERTCASSSSEDVVAFHYTGGAWVKCGTGNGSVASISATSLSPFLIAKATAKTSAQTGEYATPYIIMISVALVSCGAIFAIRAKKATK